MKRAIPWIAILVAIAAGELALGLRWWAARELPVDYDEPVYGQAAATYASAIRHADFDRLLNYLFNYEHPALYKLVYGIVLAASPPSPNWLYITPTTGPPPAAYFPQFYISRLVSVIFGTASVVVIALISPLAGLFLAGHTYAVKYTSQVYLEALPLLLSALSVLAYSRSRQGRTGWWVLSAVLLGFSVASKYLYAIAGIGILVDWLWYEVSVLTKAEKPRPWTRLWRVLAWGFLAGLAFFASDPVLWPAPVERLAGSLAFSVLYQQGEWVSTVGYPLWQPLVWLTQSAYSHPDIVFIDYRGFDAGITALALIGVVRQWRKSRVIVLWWVLGMAFLLMWGTKWPQYILTILVPLSLCAAAGVELLWDWGTAIWQCHGSGAVWRDILTGVRLRGQDQPGADEGFTLPPLARNTILAVEVLIAVILIGEVASFFASISSAQSIPGPLPAASPAARLLAEKGVASNAEWTPVSQMFDDVEMVLVPAGCFEMGGAGTPDPGYRQCLEAPFWLDRFEVTNARYDGAGITGPPAQPRSRVTWYEAGSHCAERGMRLPTELEWEYAARGPDGLLFPWGADFQAERVVYGLNSFGEAASVGSRPGGVSWVGALDMSGNIWEWVSSAYLPYPYDPEDGREGPDAAERVLRGGSFNYRFRHYLQTNARFKDAPGYTTIYYGFRCAQDYSP
jgi:formylglycine-generating enzyme required for sulfatase activity